MHCPHCKSGVEKGGLSLLSGSDLGSDSGSDQKETPKKGVRGKAREYTQSFEIAWKAYGRREQKFEAFAVWLVRSKEVGGEPQLLTLILTALKWQGPGWANDGWRFAPYFERYLKRRKWEDERPAQPTRDQSVPPWKQAERDEEARKRQQASDDAKARRELQARLDAAGRSAG